MSENIREPEEKKEEVKLAEPIKVEAKESLGQVDENARYEAILKALKEGVTGVPTSFTWTKDVIQTPSDTAARLRRYVDFVEIPKGADRARWYAISALSFGSLSAGTPPSESSQAIATVEAQAAEYGALQSLTYTDLESANVNLVKAIEESMLRAALVKEDELILSAINSDANVQSVFGGAATSESGITNETDFRISYTVLTKAIQKLHENGVDFGPGEIVLVVHPKQYGDLLRDPAIYQIYSSDIDAIRTGQVPEIAGAKVIVSTKVPTGTGGGASPPTTYHAALFVAKFAVGLAVARDLLIEQFRNVSARKVDLMGSIRAAAKVLVPKACVKIITS